MERILKYICIFLALIVVLPIHEFAHAFIADKNGDLTPRLAGRLTINPLAHFDILGIVCFVLAGFGWAKPVPINPSNFRHQKSGRFFVAIAGVVANYILAFLVLPLFYLSLKIPDFGYFTTVLQRTLAYIVSLSISFFVFNILPLYPLDGFMAIDALTKHDNWLYRFLRYYGIYVLYALFILGIIADFTGIWQLDILGIVISFLAYYLGWPIYAFWGLIF